jgi:hypothetical protein
MPNKIADHRRRVCYIEEKDHWEDIKKAARKIGISPSNLIRMATLQLCEKLQQPGARIGITIHS